MGSFRRAFFGYRRPEVDAAITAAEAQITDLGRRAAERDRCEGEKVELEAELGSLSGMVIEREREIRGLNDRLHEADQRYDRSIASLESVTARLQEIEAQARGQATRIRMKALREAVEVARRAQIVSESESGEAETGEDGTGEVELFQGPVTMEVGPVGDYSQLVGLEDKIGGLGASEISIERFSEGRATLSMNLDEPVALLRALEEHAPMEFKISRTADDGLVLDADDDSGSERAA
jgi:uncharacterized coiled-coil protein SlyX